MCARDPKGLYSRAREGRIKNLTGIDSAYEVPEHSELVLDAGAVPAIELANRVLELLADRGLLI
jgi:adenylylsulfate kinase-like enzyme